MSNVPPPSHPYGGGPSQSPLPEPRPGWIPGSELPGAPPAPPAPTGPYAPGPQPPYQPYADPYADPYGNGPQGPPPAAPKRRIGWILPVAVVVVLAGVAAIVLTRGGDDGGSGVEVGAAAEQVEAALEPFDDLAPEDTLALEGCPTVDLDDVAAVVPRGFDAEAALATVEAAIRRSGAEARDPLIIECVAYDDVRGFSVGVGPAPRGGFDAFVERVETADYDEDEAVAFEGGTLHPFCFDTATGETCETMWVKGDLHVALSAGGDDADRELTTTWLRAALAGIVADVARMEPDDVVSTGTEGTDGPDADATEAAAANVDAALAQFATLGGGGGGAGAPLVDCGGIDIAAVGALAPVGFDAATALAGTIDGSVLRPGTPSDPILLQCLASDQVFGVGFSVGVGLAPTDAFETYIARLGVVDYDPADTVAFAGGTLHPFCFDAGGIETCQTSWIDPRLQIVLSAAPGIDRGATTAWLQAALEGVIADLSVMDPAAVVAAG